MARRKLITLRSAEDLLEYPESYSIMFAPAGCMVRIRGLWVNSMHVEQFGKPDSFTFLDRDKGLGLYVQCREWGIKAWYPEDWEQQKRKTARIPSTTMQIHKAQQRLLEVEEAKPVRRLRIRNTQGDVENTLAQFRQGQQVAYVPEHARGDVTHRDCKYGVVSCVGSRFVFVLFSKDVQDTPCNPSRLRIL